VTQPSDRFRALYDERAAQQYGDPVPLPDPAVDRKFARICALVREHLPAGSLLDAGCGDGRYLAALGAGAERTAGVDLSARILETARATAARAGVEPELAQASLEELPFGDGEFDVVLCSQVIEHVVDAPAAARELVRVLRPGGTLVLSTDNARNVVSRVLNAPRTGAVRLLGLRGSRGRIESPAHAYRATELKALLETVGLEVERLETFRFHLAWPLDPIPLQRLLNLVDERLPPHGLGDILVAVARR
jgi:2-polyprenyl-3-methyl-5-hydroxy-6-metoxy-1,4-benzoquinol methylase